MSDVDKVNELANVLLIYEKATELLRLKKKEIFPEGKLLMAHTETYVGYGFAMKPENGHLDRVTIMIDGQRFIQCKLDEVKEVTTKPETWPDWVKKFLKINHRREMNIRKG